MLLFLYDYYFYKNLFLYDKSANYKRFITYSVKGIRRIKKDLISIKLFFNFEMFQSCIAPQFLRRSDGGWREVSRWEWDETIDKASDRHKWVYRIIRPIFVLRI